MAVEFVPIDRDTPYLLPPSVQDYLPEDHLARFVAEMVDELDTSALSGVYTGKGKKPYHPAMLVGLLFYGYATGTFSSRKLEKASYDSIAVRFLCANTHPDHDTIASFRKRFLKELEGFFVEILLLGQAMGLVKLGTVSLDGTKIKANASKHKALSWAYANKLQAQLQAEVEELLRLIGAQSRFPHRQHRVRTGEHRAAAGSRGKRLFQDDTTADSIEKRSSNHERRAT